MEVKEDIKRTYITKDGKEFKTIREAEAHEMEEYRKTVPESSKYVLGFIHDRGAGWFSKFKRQEYKNGKIKFRKQGGTSNIKYAYKFKTFEDAYNNRIGYYGREGKDEILTLEAATAASELNAAEDVERTKRDQKYVCEYDRYPVEDGEYITNMGMVTWARGEWTTKEVTVFWMKKTTKNTKR